MFRATTSKILTRGITCNVFPHQQVVPTLTVGLLSKKGFISVTTPDKAAAVETITQTLVSPSPGLDLNLLMIDL